MPSYIDVMVWKGVAPQFSRHLLLAHDRDVLVPDYLKISINENTENYDKQNA